MKKKKGFTIIELTGVVIVISLIIVIVFPAITQYINDTRKNVYVMHEKDMASAAANLISKCSQDNQSDCVIEKGESKTIYLKELVDKKFSDKIKDPKKTDEFCSEEDSYVVVTNKSGETLDLDYQVCLVCGKYKSGVCKTTKPTDTCDKTMDSEKPVCSTISGSSSIWSNDYKIISVKCEDNGCGCRQGEYYKKFEESVKTGTITIFDKAGNKADCEVDVYVDKDAPTCELEVSGSLGKNGWYGGNAPIVKFKSKEDQNGEDADSGLSTYGIGVSSNDYDFNKKTSYTVAPGITTVYGYVKDNAGNVGTCSVEVKYDNVKPTGVVTYGYQVYSKEDSYLGSKNGQTIKLNNITEEYGNIIGVRVTLSSNKSGMVTKLSGTGINVDRTISSGVTEMLYTINKGKYNDLVIDMGSSSNVNSVQKIELIKDIIETQPSFYTKENVSVYVSAKDSLSGKAEYSFDGGKTYQLENKQSISINQEVKVTVKDYAGNTSGLIEGNINNIDKLKPNVGYAPNGGEYTINVSESNKVVSSKITASDQIANEDYAMSGIRSVEYQWMTSKTTPTTWIQVQSGATLTKESSGGSNYLYIRIVDKAGNEAITVSEDFNVGYQVIYDCNGGNNCPSEQRKVYNQALTLSLDVPTRSGYEFVGWGLTNSTHSTSYNSGSSYTSNSPVKLYAIWRKKIEITFMPNGATISDGTNSTSTSSIIKSCEMWNSETSCDITSLNITRSGYTIIGWNTNPTATTSQWDKNVTKSVSENETYYAITLKKQVIAIYSETDKSLRFYDTFVEVKNGETYNNLKVTQVYSDFIDIDYSNSSNGDVPWNDKKIVIEKVVVEDTITPSYMVNWFNGMSNASYLDVKNVNTTKITNMFSMFFETGTRVSSFKIDGLASWDTSNVTNMQSMFNYAGHIASTWSIGDISQWNTSKVTDMSRMFNGVGRKATIELNLSTKEVTKNGNVYKAWDTSKVTNMRSMFNSVAYQDGASIKLYLNGWDTSNVNNMSHMFNAIGYGATTCSISGISELEVDSVTTMESMFRDICFAQKSLNLDLSKWNTAKVKNMRDLFFSGDRGKNATRSVNLNISNWNTSSVEDMAYMFRGIGQSASSFQLTGLGDLETTSVTNMTRMFSHIGHNSRVVIDLSEIEKWNPPKVKDISKMFFSAGNIKELNLSNWTLSNVETCCGFSEEATTIIKIPSLSCDINAICPKE